MGEEKKMKIYLQEKGVIGKEDCWCCIHEGYLYIADTLEELVTVLNTEWEHDKHLVG